MKNGLKETTPAPLQPIPQQTEQPAKTAKKKWQGLRTELRELGKMLAQQIRKPFQPRSIHSYTVTRVDSPATQVSQKSHSLENLLKETTAQVFEQGSSYLGKKDCKHIASAYLVMHGLARYKTASNGTRTDFTLKPAKHKASSTQKAAMEKMIKGMSWPQMRAFHANDTLVIPRKANILKGTARLIAGQQRRLKADKAALINANPKTVKQHQLAMSNPKSVFVVVYGDRTPEKASHAALMIGGKGSNSKEPLYVSHLGVGGSVFSGIKAALPKVTIDSTSNIFEEDCEQFGKPDYVVELTGLNKDDIVQRLQSQKDKGYDLLTQNCSTRVGELLLAGVPEPERKGLRKPNGFWTPWNITVMAQELWRREQIDNPDFK